MQVLRSKESQSSDSTVKKEPDHPRDFQIQHTRDVDDEGCKIPAHLLPWSAPRREIVESPTADETFREILPALKCFHLEGPIQRLVI